MNDTERLSGLIGKIYDAALDPPLWSGALREARDFIGGSSAGIVTKDAAANGGGVCYDDGGIEPGYTELYFQRYVTLDPCTTGHFFSTVKNPVSTADLIPYDRFLETRFYKEWVKPQGFVDYIGAALEKSATTAMVFGVMRRRSEGMFDGDARRRVRLIAPHMRRAVLIGNAIDLQKTATATFTDALDGLSAGVILVDARGRVVHANAAGDAMLGAGDFLKIAGGRLTTGDAERDHHLRGIFTATGNDDGAIGVRGVALPLVAADGERYVAHVLPLTSGARRPVGVAHGAVAALFVHKAALQPPSPPEAIGQTYKLTPTELRVLLAIVDVGGVPEIADAFGIAETTVKTHLGRLYAKTGAGRQADLVKLVAGFSSPLLR